MKFSIPIEEFIKKAPRKTLIALWHKPLHTKCGGDKAKVKAYCKFMNDIFNVYHSRKYPIPILLAKDEL